MASLAKKAQALFSTITNHSVADLYPDADLADTELADKLRYIMQGRTTMFLAFELGRTYKHYLAIGEIKDAQLTNDILDLLRTERVTSTAIRNWWHDGGSDWAAVHKEAVCSREIRDKKCFVVRDDDSGVFVTFETTTNQYTTCQSPADTNGFNLEDYTINSITAFVASVYKKPVRIFTINRAVLSSPEQVL